MIIKPEKAIGGVGAPSSVKSEEQAEEHANTDVPMDEWVFEGKKYSASVGKIPEPLAGAFRPSTAAPTKTPPYDYDRSKFSVYFSTCVDESRDGAQAGVVSLANGDEIVGVIPHKEDFRIELANAKDGKFPITQEELLKAVHAAKLTVGAALGLFDE